MDQMPSDRAQVNHRTAVEALRLMAAQVQVFLFPVQRLESEF